MLKNIFLVAAVVFLFFGCASTNQQSMQGSKSDNQMVHNSVIPKNDLKYINLQIKRSEYIPHSDTYEMVASELRKEVIGLLQKNYPGAEIDIDTIEQDKHDGVKVDLEIVHFAYVSGAKRFLVGAFAGNASLNVNIKFENITSNSVLLEDNFATSSSKWGGIFAATTSKQIKQAAEYIVNQISATEI